MSVALLESRFAALEGLEQTSAQAGRMWVAQADRLAELIALTPHELEKGLAAEVGAALRVGEGVAHNLLDVAFALHQRPRVRVAVLNGRLNPRQAEVVLDELCCVDPVVADQILDVLLAAAGGPVSIRPASLRHWVNRRTLAADPGGAKKKRRLAEREQTGVRYRALPQGLAQKITTGPAVAIQTAMRQLDAMTPPVSAEDDRTVGQLWVDTELGAISQAAQRTGIGPVPIEIELEIPVRSGAYRVPPGARLPEPIVIRTDLSGLAQATASTTPAAADDQPQPQPEPEPEPQPQPQAQPEPRPRPHYAGLASLAELIERDLAQQMAHHKGGGDGVPPPQPGPAPAPSPALTPASVPTLAGHGPIDPALLGQHLPQASIRRLFIDPVTGVCALDRTPLNLAELATAALPQPPPATSSYTPTAAQKRVVRARYRTCAFPGCQRQARHSDLDHAIAFHAGGQTTIANLHPLCRHHHQIKQRGWHVQRHPDGSSTWTSPAGKHYRSTPGEQ